MLPSCKLFPIFSFFTQILDFTGQIRTFLNSIYKMTNIEKDSKKSFRNTEEVSTVQHCNTLPHIH